MKTYQVMVAGVVYSLIGFAYMYATFPTRNEMMMVIARLDRIEGKLDTLNACSKIDPQWSELYAKYVAQH